MQNNFNIDGALEKIKQKLTDQLELVGELIETEAKLRCPVGTPESTGVAGYVGGTLRDSITHKVSEGALSVKIGTNVEYAPYVEYGTYKMKSQPYLMPAVLENGEQIKKLFEE